MLMVGLTGGIGAGKSAVATRLAELGAVIIDADRLAREVVEPGTDGLAEIVAAFGSAVLTPGGTLDRPALGAKVFGDETARRRLERIIHPRVRERTAEMVRAAPPDAIVVNDVPLLVETGLAPTYHIVIVVSADREVRIERLIRDRGMSAAEAAARIGAQADDATRQAAADVVLPNEDDLVTLRSRVDDLWRDRLVEFERNVRLHATARKAAELNIVSPDPAWPQAAARLIARIRHQLGSTSTSTSSSGSGSGSSSGSGSGSGSTSGSGSGSGSAGVHHIGSTAVPGLPAKDIIDLMLSVRTLAEADALTGPLAAAGFPRRSGEWVDRARRLPGETWPKRVHGSADPGRPMILHVRVAGSPAWRFALLMRDHLRAVPAARDAYAARKAELALRFAERVGYAEAKEPWFDEEARAADDWALATGWQPPVF